MSYRSHVYQIGPLYLSLERTWERWVIGVTVSRPIVARVLVGLHVGPLVLWLAVSR